MAIYAKLDGDLPVNAVRAVTLPPPGAFDLTGNTVDPPLTVADGMDAQATVLNGRYKTGGATTWERPATPEA